MSSLFWKNFEKGNNRAKWVFSIICCQQESTNFSLNLDTLDLMQTSDIPIKILENGKRGKLDHLVSFCLFTLKILLSKINFSPASVNSISLVSLLPCRVFRAGKLTNFRKVCPRGSSSRVKLTCIPTIIHCRLYTLSFDLFGRHGVPSGKTQSKQASPVCA